MANNSIFDDSLIGRMLNETFQETTQANGRDRSVLPIEKILQENGVCPASITEYATFWRIDFQTGPIDFPINWGPVKDVKKVLVTKEIVFVSADSDFQCLCKIFKADMLGIYKHDDRCYFFSVQKPNLAVANFLNTSAQKIAENNIHPIPQYNSKISTAA